MSSNLNTNDFLRSVDGVTSPVSVGVGSDDDIFLSLRMTNEGVAALEGLARATHQNLEDVIKKAFILYRISVEAQHQGKAIGIASSEDVLEEVFVGL